MDLPTKIRPKRSDLPPDAMLCDYCTAKCCRYFALPIETPTEKKDYEYIRWFLMHGQAAVFVEKETWYILVYTTCKHLLPDNRCGTYLTRPEICREYSTNDCEFDDSWVYEQYFETSEQVAEYMDAVLPKFRGESIRGEKPPMLPILA